MKKTQNVKNIYLRMLDNDFYLSLYEVEMYYTKTNILLIVEFNGGHPLRIRLAKR